MENIARNQNRCLLLLQIRSIPKPKQGNMHRQRNARVEIRLAEESEREKSTGRLTTGHQLAVKRPTTAHKVPQQQPANSSLADLVTGN